MSPIKTLKHTSLAAVFSAILMLIPLASAQEDFVGLYLTWEDDPATTMTVNWVNLYRHTPNVTIYRKLGSDQWKTAEGSHHELYPSTLQVRRVRLQDLEPDTEYEFYPGDSPPTGWNRPARFRTMPVELERPLRFVTGGDMLHTRAMANAMNAQAAALDPDFAVIGGDLAYADGVDAAKWVDWLHSWMRFSPAEGNRHLPLVVAIGNHEVIGQYHGRAPEDAPYFYGLFALPEGKSYYALDFRDYLSFIVLDTDHTQPIIGDQSEWLQRAMEKRKEQQFIFPVYHYPAYGSALSKSPPGKLPYDTPRAESIREHWIPTFERYGVSIVFENDHHTYKRTYPILRNKRDDDRGIIYLGDGCWGVHTRDVPEPGVAWYLAHAESRKHLYHVTLHPEGRIDVEAVDAEGEIFDTLSLDRPRTQPFSDE